MTTSALLVAPDVESTAADSSTAARGLRHISGPDRDLVAGSGQAGGEGPPDVPRPDDGDVQ